MSNPHSPLFLLQQLVVDLALINRNHYLAGTQRKENDIEHSFSVVLLCWFILDKYKLDLDISKVLKYAIAHDFVELHAGDVNAFASEEDRIKKVEDEEKALSKMSDEYSVFSDMVQAMKAYEAKADKEAVFVWTVDKMQALIMGDLDNWRPYVELEISYESFTAKYSELLERSSLDCRAIFESLIEYCKSTYFDQPIIKNL